jgi:hypothetical protein
MNAAATKNTLKLKKLLEANVPGAEFFFLPVSVAIGLADESLSDETPVPLAPVAVGPPVVAFWNRMWGELSAVG